MSGFRQHRLGDLQDSVEWAYYVLREDLLETLVDAALAQVARPRAGESDNYEVSSGYDGCAACALESSLTGSSSAGP